MTPGGYVFVGGVDVSLACLEALVDSGLPPALAIGYDESRVGASGYVDLGALAERGGFQHARTGDVNDPAIVERIEGLNPDLIYVIGWSQLVKDRLLAAPRNGCVGIHPTPLPEGRGRAPIPWTILKGLRRTGSTMYFLTKGVDDGDIVACSEFDVDPREDAASLYAKHRRAHVELVREHTPALLAGDAPRTPQDDTRATYWERRRPEDGRIDWARPAVDVDRLVRAVTRPFPGAFTESAEGRITIWRAEPASTVDAPPGTWVRRDDATFVACGEGSLRILESEPDFAARRPAA